jgi:hypothetical protein
VDTTQFLLRNLLELRWTPQLIKDGTIILSMIIENLYFLDSLNFLPMSKERRHILISHARRDISPTFLTRPTNWTMLALIPNPSSMGQTTSSSPIFGMVRRADNIFSNNQELLAYCMDDVNVLRQACCAFRNLFLKLVKMDPFRQAITIWAICSKGFGQCSLNQTLGVIPRARYRMRYRQSSSWGT